MHSTFPVLAAAVATLSWASAAPVSIEEFSLESVQKSGWSVVNDGVMGGLSKGRFEATPDGVLKFRGTLSLENNGGFSSIRTGLLKLDLSSGDGVTLRVRGDGRTYQLRFASDARFREREVSFNAEFKTPKGEWAEIFIPFSGFGGSFRGVELPEAKFNPAKIQRIGLLIADKKPGPFALEIDWIRSHSKP